MAREPLKGLQFGMSDLAVGITAFVIGIPVAFYSMVFSGHGGPAWPVTIVCAPAALICRFVEDGPTAAMLCIGISALLIAIYAVSLRRSWKVFLALLAGHLLCVGVVTLLVIKNGP